MNVLLKWCWCTLTIDYKSEQQLEQRPNFGVFVSHWKLYQGKVIACISNAWLTKNGLLY
jgi:hypothetical protein